MSLAKITTALIDASVHYDKAEVAWQMKACDAAESFETLGESGEPRFHGLDSMLATALQSLKTGEAAGTWANKTASA